MQSLYLNSDARVMMRMRTSLHPIENIQVSEVKTGNTHFTLKYCKEVAVQVLICWLFTWAKITRYSPSVDDSAGCLDLQALAGHRTAHGELRDERFFPETVKQIQTFFLRSCDLNVKDRWSLITSIQSSLFLISDVRD